MDISIDNYDDLISFIQIPYCNFTRSFDKSTICIYNVDLTNITLPLKISHLKLVNCVVNF